MSGFIKKLIKFNEEEKEINETFESNFDSFEEEEESFGEDSVQVFNIPIDLYQDDDNIYLKVFVPGIEPEKINIELTRDMVEISGERYQEEEIAEENYVQKELVWGEFQRKILLPDEVDIHKVKATNRNGMLVLKMPKLDKNKKIKISLGH